MLTLSRKLGERITIGSDIEITVVDISRGKVRLGIRAPRELPVHRTEIVERIGEENRRALTPAASISESSPTIDIEGGLPGLREHKRFQLHEIEGSTVLGALVSTADPSVSLLVLDAQDLQGVPFPIERAKLAAGLPDAEVAVALVVTLPNEGVATVNLLAPIVIGLETRRGVQVILDGSGLTTACPVTGTSRRAG